MPKASAGDIAATPRCFDKLELATGGASQEAIEVVWLLTHDVNVDAFPESHREAAERLQRARRDRLRDLLAAGGFELMQAVAWLRKAVDDGTAHSSYLPIVASYYWLSLKSDDGSVSMRNLRAELVGSAYEHTERADLYKICKSLGLRLKGEVGRPKGNSGKK